MKMAGPAAFTHVKHVLITATTTSAFTASSNRRCLRRLGRTPMKLLCTCFMMGAGAVGGSTLLKRKTRCFISETGGFQEQTGTDCNGKGTSMIEETHRCIFFILNSVCYQWRCVCKPANVPRAPVYDRCVQLSDAAHLRRFISKAGHATAFLLRMCLKSLTCQGSLSLLAAGSF